MVQKQKGKGLVGLESDRTGPEEQIAESSRHGLLVLGPSLQSPGAFFTLKSIGLTARPLNQKRGKAIGKLAGIRGLAYQEALNPAVKIPSSAGQP